MRVRITKVESKDIKTKAGQQMTLRIAQGMNEEGDVFKFTLPRSHPDVQPGTFQVVATPYIDFDAGLGGRVALQAFPPAQAGKDPIKG